MLVIREWNKIALYFLILVAILGIGLYIKNQSNFPRVRDMRLPIEYFSSPAVAPTEPTCLNRSLDAQILARMFKKCDDEYNSPTEDSLDRTEFLLILQKLTCLDADVQNNGVGGYNTLNLPFNTSHDTEPLTNFVGRCLNNATRPRDLAIIIDKYESRGKRLIKQMSNRIGMDERDAFINFENIIRITMQSMKNKCLGRHSSLDIPYGPRDPGYFTPFSIERLALVKDTF